MLQQGLYLHEVRQNAAYRLQKAEGNGWGDVQKALVYLRAV